MTPASGKYLLDTSIIIALMEGDQGVLVHSRRAAEVFVPVIALGELFFGAAISGRSFENTVKVERFALSRRIVPCDLNVAREYGRLKQRLKEQGRPIPENDIWIAAAALYHGMTLVTRNAHFQHVKDLVTTDWSVAV